MDRKRGRYCPNGSFRPKKSLKWKKCLIWPAAIFRSARTKEKMVQINSDCVYTVTYTIYCKENILGFWSVPKDDNHLRQFTIFSWIANRMNEVTDLGQLMPFAELVNWLTYMFPFLCWNRQATWPIVSQIRWHKPSILMRCDSNFSVIEYLSCSRAPLLWHNSSSRTSKTNSILCNSVQFGSIAKASKWTDMIVWS